MSLTLIEASKLSTDVLQKGVIEQFARTSPVLEMLPFMEISGNSYKFNVEKALPTVAFRDVNQGYVENTGSLEQKSVGLVILGGDSDVDKFLVATRGNVQDIRAIHTNMKAKALAKEYTRTFFYGDSSVNSLEFDGIATIVKDTANDLDAALIEEKDSKLSLRKLHALLDAVEGGADVMFMSKAMRREVQAILEGQTHYIQTGKDAFGRPVEMFGDVQIRTVEDELLPFGVSGGEIYAIKFGAMEYVSGLRNGQVSVRDLGELDTLPVFRTRIEFYCGLAIFREKAVARLKNVKRGTDVTA